MHSASSLSTGLGSTSHVYNSPGLPDSQSVEFFNSSAISSAFILITSHLIGFLGLISNRCILKQVYQEHQMFHSWVLWMLFLMCWHSLTFHQSLSLIISHLPYQPHLSQGVDGGLNPRLSTQKSGKRNEHPTIHNHRGLLYSQEKQTSYEYLTFTFAYVVCTFSSNDLNVWEFLIPPVFLATFWPKLLMAMGALAIITAAEVVW